MTRRKFSREFKVEAVRLVMYCDERVAARPSLYMNVGLTDAGERSYQSPAPRIAEIGAEMEYRDKPAGHIRLDDEIGKGSSDGGNRFGSAQPGLVVSIEPNSPNPIR